MLGTRDVEGVERPIEYIMISSGGFSGDKEEDEKEIHVNHTSVN